jgi:hypothetical protein
MISELYFYKIFTEEMFSLYQYFLLHVPKHKWQT